MLVGRIIRTVLWLSLPGECFMRVPQMCAFSEDRVPACYQVNEHITLDHFARRYKIATNWKVEPATPHHVAGAFCMI